MNDPPTGDNSKVGDMPEYQSDRNGLRAEIGVMTPIGFAPVDAHGQPDLSAIVYALAQRVVTLERRLDELVNRP